MKLLAFIFPLAWLALFFWVDAFEIGIAAGLVSFIGFFAEFLLVRRFDLRWEWGIASAAAVLAPIVVMLALAGWAAIFPPEPCVGDDCVTITVTLPSES